MRRTEITVKRPDGTTETVTKDFGMNDHMFEKARKATRDAGRGELISYRVIEPETSEADRERGQIEALFAKAESLRDYPGRYFPALKKAEEVLEEWKEKFPAAAKEESDRKRKAQANDLRRKANDALTYDADGWLSDEDKQERHDAMMRRASEIEKEANR